MNDHTSIDERYSRQLRFPPIGPGGQTRLHQARVVVVGCGALGTVLLDQLVRAGVGRVRCIDRDFVEPSNLQRQSLYDEADAAVSRPKAIAAAERLRQVNRQVEIEPMVVEVDARNVSALIAGADLVLDGSDNFRTRHLLNEACIRAKIPWIYGACVGSYGVSLPVVPDHGPCLRCLQDQLPGPGETPTCDTAGVIGPIVHLVAAQQAAEAIKHLVGATMRHELWTCDLWTGRQQQVDVRRWRDPTCAVCGPTPIWPTLHAPVEPDITLCGRDAVQIRLGSQVDLFALAQRLGSAVVAANEYLLRWHDGERRVTAFRDGRVLVQGVADGSQARAIVDRWLG